MLERDDAEHPVPEEWRPTFRQIADAFVAGDYRLQNHAIEGVAPVDALTADNIAQNITAYGSQLCRLNERTWDRSICRWMDGYWQALVDLTTAAEPVSDLTLHAKLYEGGNYRLEVQSVHVP